MWRKRYAELSANRFRTEPNTTRSESRWTNRDSDLKVARSGHCDMRLTNMPRYTPSRSRPNRRSPVRNGVSPTLDVRVISTSSIEWERRQNSTCRPRSVPCRASHAHLLHAARFRGVPLLGIPPHARCCLRAREEEAVNIGDQVCGLGNEETHVATRTDLGYYLFVHVLTSEVVETRREGLALATWIDRHEPWSGCTAGRHVEDHR